MFIFKLEKDFIKNAGEEILKDYFGINTNNFFLLKDELLTLLYVQKYKWLIKWNQIKIYKVIFIKYTNFYIHKIKFSFKKNKKNQCHFNNI